MNKWPDFNPASERCVNLNLINVDDFMETCAGNRTQDSADAAAYGAWVLDQSSITRGKRKDENNEALKEANEREAFQKRFEYHLTPKSIEQSADHKMVVVLWKDRTKTIVRLSKNDKDDIDTAFAYALAKKVFGSNTHLKKVVRQKWTIHNARKDKAHD